MKLLHLTSNPETPNKVVLTTTFSDNVESVLSKYYNDDDAHPYLIHKVDGPICEEDPNDLFIDAWEFDNIKKPTKVILNFEVVKKIHEAKIRYLRDQSLILWDDDHNLAMYRDDKKALKIIKKAKQELRKVPGLIEEPLKNAETIGDVFNIFPVELKLNIHADVLNRTHPIFNIGLNYLKSPLLGTPKI